MTSMGYTVFTYTFHVWGAKRDVAPVATHGSGTVPGKSLPARSRISAGLLMFRRRKDKIEVLLAHPGGPLFVRKDDGAWTIPKGEAAPEEDLLTRAQIEFEEEVGFRPENVQEWIELGWIQQKGGKIVHAWAFEGDLPDQFECKSNLFELEWPPRSGKYQSFPEVDRACFFSEKKARRKLKSRQVPFLDRLRAALTDRDADPPRRRATIS